MTPPTTLSAVVTAQQMSMAINRRIAATTAGQVAMRLVEQNANALGDSVKYPVGHRPEAPRPKRSKRTETKADAAEAVIVENVEWENSVAQSVVAARRNPDYALNRISELGRQWAMQPLRIVVATILANPTCYDGKTFFSTTHKLGKSGTQTNVLTKTEVPSLQVTNPDYPTPEEAVLAITDVVGHLKTLKAEDGEPINEGAQSFAVMFESSMFGRMYPAMTANQLAQGQTNVIANTGPGWEWLPFDTPRLPSASKRTFYVFQVDPAFAASPFLLQQERPVEFELLDMMSEHAKVNGKILALGRWSGNGGPGEWAMAAKATFST